MVGTWFGCLQSGSFLKALLNLHNAGAQRCLFTISTLRNAPKLYLVETRLREHVLELPFELSSEDAYILGVHELTPTYRSHRAGLAKSTWCCNPYQGYQSVQKICEDVFENAVFD